MTAGNNGAHHRTRKWLSDQHAEVLTEAMIGPAAANPFYREVLAVSPTHYFGLRVPLLKDGAIESIFEPVPVQKPDAIVSRALAMPEIRGFVNWMRFPIYEVQARPHHLWSRRLLS
ncbi:MAG TPA: hypothetical protein VE954_16565 [Oligoflexus sp.]|uniref:hypothetical protein n=1 Tax=Oligoflexus sp. TaxID=1971216 RepID=UPI002D571A44|nr:hypothetical protein [Oligoflexus sp.]HYX34712.1 hypothetical protein [Oligoflexus sp.]